MTTSSSECRASIIAGLRELADTLEAHPDLPAPVWLTVFPDGTDDEQFAAVRHAAAVLGVNVTQPTYGSHQHATRRFGGDYPLGIDYDVVAIPKAATDAYNARNSYNRNVRVGA